MCEVGCGGELRCVRVCVWGGGGGVHIYSFRGGKCVNKASTLTGKTLLPVGSKLLLLLLLLFYSRTF